MAGILYGCILHVCFIVLFLLGWGFFLQLDFARLSFNMAGICKVVSLNGWVYMQPVFNTSFLRLGFARQGYMQLFFCMAGLSQDWLLI